ncbi:MAG: sulfur carrier protein ThiS [Arenicellales bacterium]
MIEVSVNNQNRTVAKAINLTDALLGWGYAERTAVAVAINQVFVAKSDYAHTILNSGDEIDIVQPISGG